MRAQSQMQDMTTGRLSRQILLFSVPLILSNLLQVLFNMSDIAVVGRFSGSAALGSVGSTATLVTLFTGFLIGMGSSVNVRTARYLGAGDTAGVHRCVHTALILSAAVGAALTVLGLCFVRPLLILMGTKENLLDGAVRYLHIYLLGMPALAIYNFGNAVFSAAGDTRRPLRFLLIAGVLNVILNLFFVIVCRWAVAGVALASILSQYVSAVLILHALASSNTDFRLYFRELRVTRAEVRPILGLGLSAGFQNSIFAIANLFIQAGVNRFNTTIVEGNSAAANADGLIYDVMAAFYVACSSFMGQNLGARKKDRVLHSYFISLAYSFGVGMALGLLLRPLGPAFLSLFTNEPAVRDAGMLRLSVMSFSYGVSAFMDCTIAASRGLGKSLVPTVMVILGSCVFRVAWIYTVFAYFGTIQSLYLLYIFSWSITAIAETIYFVYAYKRQTADCPEPSAAHAE